MSKSKKLSQVQNELVDMTIQPLHEILDIEPGVRINDNPYMPYNYAKMLVIAQSTGGKTTTIFNIISKGWLNYDKLWIWSNTMYDKDYQALLEGLTDVGAVVYEYPHEPTEEDKNACIQANVIISDTLENFPSCNDIRRSQLTLTTYDDDDSDASASDQMKHLLVLDDFGNNSFFRSNDFGSFIDTCRHAHVQMIVVQHSLANAMPKTRGKFTQFCLFNGSLNGKSAVKHAHETLGTVLSISCFTRLYNLACAEKYGFLYIDLEEPDYKKRYRKGFAGFFDPHLFDTR